MQAFPTRPNPTEEIVTLRPIVVRFPRPGSVQPIGIISTDYEANHVILKSMEYRSLPYYPARRSCALPHSWRGLILGTVMRSQGWWCILSLQCQLASDAFLLMTINSSAVLILAQVLLNRRFCSILDLSPVKTSYIMTSVAETACRRCREQKVRMHSHITFDQRT